MKEKSTKKLTKKLTKNWSKMIVGIDPGLTGSFCSFNGDQLKTFPMPILKNGKDKAIDFDGVHELLTNLQDEHAQLHIYLERAVPMAMGSKHAFNYGRGFAALEIAISLLQVPVTYVEPQKWSKVMHEGISSDLKPKAKSIIAVHRLFPKLVKSLRTNKNGKLHEGDVDAFLIAAYGHRMLGHVETPRTIEMEDFP